MKKLIALMILCFVSLSVPVRADVSYGSFLFNGLDENGNPINNGTYAVVLDLDGDGFNGTPYTSQSTTVDTSSSYLWDSDDLLVDFGSIANGEAFAFRKIATAQIPAQYNANVDQYYLLWFESAASCPLGDTNGDCKVDLNDLNNVRNNFGSPNAPAGDTNNDGVVDLNDLNNVRNNFGATTAPGPNVNYGAERLGVAGADPGNYTKHAVGGVANLHTVTGAGDMRAAGNSVRKVRKGENK